MAAGQLQQQYALPGAYNAPSFATETERTATAITMGVTNVALPGAAMATGLSLSMAPMLGSIEGSTLMPAGSRARSLWNRGWNSRAGSIAKMAPGAWGRAGMFLGSGGAVKGGMAGLGKVGAMRGAMGLAGGVAGVAGSFMLPMAIGEVYSAAADRMIEGQRDFLATRQMVRELPGLGGFGSQSVLGGGLGGPTSIASSPSSVMQLQGNLTQIGANFGASTAQMRNITGGLASSGAIDTSSVQSISRSLRQSMQELKGIAKLVGTDLQEATNLYSQLKQMGFSSSGGRSQALRQMTGASGISGMSLSQVGAIANNTMGLAGQMGLNPAAGMGIATSAISNAAYRQSAGSINPMYLNRVGGMEGYAQRMAQMRVGVIGSGGADAAISRLYNPSGELRAGGLDDLMGRDRLRSRGSFNRNFDPYQMGRMRREFSDMSDSVILGGVNSIQARNAGDPTRANRRQYEYLAQFGITDPDEQLEYLGSMRSRPRAEALQTAQSMRNTALTSGGSPQGIDLETRLREGVDRLVRGMIGGGESLERYGAALQVRAEQMTSRVNDALLGSERNMAGGMYTEEALNFGRSSALSGGPGVYNNPLGTLERQLGENPAMRAVLSGSRNITGVTAQSHAGGVYRAAFGATQSVNRFAGSSGGTVFGRGSFYDDFGDMVSTTGNAQNGTFVGSNARGERQYASNSEFIQMVASQYGAAYDPATQRFAREDSALTERLIYGQGDRFRGLEDFFLGGGVSATGNSFDRIANTGPVGRTLGWALGRSADNTLGRGGSNYQLNETDREDLRQNRLQYLDEFSRTAFEDEYRNLTGSQQMSLLSALRQMPGQIGGELAGDASGMSEAELAAAISGEIATTSFANTIGGGSADTRNRASGRMISARAFMEGDAVRGAVRDTQVGNIVNRLRGTAGMEYGPDYVEGVTGHRDPSHLMINTAVARGLLSPRQQRVFDQQMERNYDASIATTDSVRAQAELAGSLGLNETDQGVLQGRFAGNQAISTIGAVRGAMMASQGNDALIGYIMGGEGFGTGGEVGAGLRGFATASVAGTSETARQSRAVGLQTVLRIIKANPALTDEQRARIGAMEEEMFASGGFRPAEGGQEMHGILKRTMAAAGAAGFDVDAGARGLDEAVALTRLGFTYAANAVGQVQAGNTLGQLRKNQVETLALALAGETIMVGGEEYKSEDLLRMVQRGTVTAEFANELFNSESLRGQLMDRGEEGSGFDIDGLVQLTGQSADANAVVAGMYSQAFGADGMVQADRLHQFRGTQGHRALTTLQQVQAERSRTGGDARGTDIALLEENFGQDMLTAMMDRMGISGEGTFGRDRLDTLVGRLEGGVDAGEKGAISGLLTTALGLGEDVTRQDQEEAERAQRRDFYRGMNECLSGSRRLPVAMFGDGSSLERINDGE